jgi:hypothetical protein
MVKPINCKTVNDGIEIPSMSQETREGLLPVFDLLAHPVTCGEDAECRAVCERIHSQLADHRLWLSLAHARPKKRGALGLQHTEGSQECASGQIGGQIHAALVLAAVAAFLSIQHRQGDPAQRVTALLTNGTAVERAAMAGAIGENPSASIPPRLIVQP